ncbi:MAG TPA: class II aldolase/adducin family protein [Spirochaetia bacterium]|nr:class II aldolase/adducin family protein [Spirochaetia bacterium]
MGVKELVEASRRYGSDRRYVLAGGGNTSYKDASTLHVKASGTTLAALSEEGLVRMVRARLAPIWTRRYSADPDLREKEALADLMAARVEGETKRPSVETLLHDLLEPGYVVHLHPSLVNGLTCGRDGERIARELVHESMIWIPVVNPGYVLAKYIRDAIEKHLTGGKEYPKILLLQNHGVFVADDSIGEIDRIYSEMMEKLEKRLVRVPDLSPIPDPSGGRLTTAVESAVQALEERGIRGPFEREVLLNPEIKRIVASRGAFSPFLGLGYTPDHLVYCKAAPIWIPAGSEGDAAVVGAEISSFFSRFDGAPRLFAVEGAGVFAIGESRAVAENAAALFLDLIAVVGFAESFGGPIKMPQDKIDFILNWEVESYRAKVSHDKT